MKVIVKSTGEELEFDISSPAKMAETWRVASEYIKAYEKFKDAIKELVPEFIGERGVSAEFDGYAFRQSAIQRQTYDKSALRQIFQDEDLLDTFLKPDKPTIDQYLKEHLEELGEHSTYLRKAMVPDGKAYQVIKLEKLVRE